MYKSRTPPAAIARQLRQEAGFGCVVCGCPIVEYHHIIEWNEKKHFDPDHMVAMCPNHHSEYGKLDKSKAYTAKQNPINIRKGRIEGLLGGNKGQKALRLGAMTVKNCGSALNFSGINLFSYSLSNGEYLLDVFLPDENFWPELEVSKNSLKAEIGGFWDIEFKTNWVKFRRKKGNIFLEIDFRGDLVEIDGRFDIAGQSVSLAEKGAKIGNAQVADVHLENCAIGWQFGPKGKLLKPNFAMVNPRAVLVTA